MRIGLTFTLKSPVSGPPSPGSASSPADEEEEFDPPETIQALTETLQQLGYDVILLGDGEEMVRRLLDGPRPDLALNLAEGRGSGRCREAWAAGALEMLGVPHTGGDALTLAVTLDKDCAKRLVRDAGVATPRWVLLDGDPSACDEGLQGLPLPLFVKPAYEGSSKGILADSLVRSREALLDAVRRLSAGYRQPVLVEEFIEGDDLTVGVIGNSPPEVLGIMRVMPTGEDSGAFFYGLDAKRDWKRRVQYECPARLSPDDTGALREAALTSWRALGCRDVARIDFRLRDHVPYFLEANPMPGLSPEYADLVTMARHAGIDYAGLIGRILHAATARESGSFRSAPPAGPHG